MDNQSNDQSTPISGISLPGTFIPAVTSNQPDVNSVTPTLDLSDAVNNEPIMDNNPTAGGVSSVEFVTEQSPPPVISEPKPEDTMILSDEVNKLSSATPAEFPAVDQVHPEPAPLILPGDSPALPISMSSMVSVTGEDMLNPDMTDVPDLPITDATPAFMPSDNTFNYPVNGSALPAENTAGDSTAPDGTSSETISTAL